MHWHIRIKHFPGPWCKTQLTPALIHRLCTLNYTFLIWTDCIASFPFDWLSNFQVFATVPADTVLGVNIETDSQRRKVHICETFEDVTCSRSIQWNSDDNQQQAVFVLFFVFFIWKQVTFSSPDVTPAWISCLFLLFVTLRSAPPRPRLAASHCSQSWCNVGLLAEENNGRIEAVWERDICSSPSSQL